MKKVFLLVPVFALACAGNSENSVAEKDTMRVVFPDTIGIDAITETLTETDSIYAFSEYKDGESLYGFKNWVGEIILKPRFNLAGDFYNGVAPVVLGEKHGLCDTTGKIIYPFKGFEFAFWLDELEGSPEFIGASEGFYAVENADGYHAFVNSRGEPITDFEYHAVRHFSEGKAAVTRDEKSGFIDTNGTEVIRLIYEQALPFSCGRASVTMDGKTGFIDHGGTMIIPAIYAEGYFFHENLCWVTKSTDYNNYFYIDTMGAVAIPGPFEQAGHFDKGEAYVWKRDACRVIDKSGKELKKLDYDCFGGC